MNTKQLRQKILDLAIRGKLVPQDPNDEPASVLLERVRAEKERLIKEGKIKRDKGVDKSHYEQLPDGWVWTTLGAYLDVRDGTHDTPKYVEKGVPLITSKNLCNGNIDFDNVKLISLNDHKSISLRSQVDDKDILFAMIGSIGNPVLVKKDKEFSIKNVALFKKISENTNMSYVRYYLEYVQDNMKIVAKGGLQPFVPLNILRTYSICIPPLDEQHRIVAAIESAFTVIDEIEHNKKGLQAAVTAAKQKILSLAIRGKLVPQDLKDEPASVLLERIRAERETLIMQGKIKRAKSENAQSITRDNSHYADLPESWEVCTLASITTPLTLNDGDWILSENMNPDGEVKLVQLGSVGYMEYIDKGFKYITADTFTELNCTEIFSGYLLINRLLGNNLNVCILPEIDGPFITTVDTCWIASSKEYDLKFLMYSIASAVFQAEVFLNAAGSTRKRISKGNLIQIPFPLPPLAEQWRIVAAIEAAFEQLDRIAECLN